MWKNLNESAQHSEKKRTQITVYSIHTNKGHYINQIYFKVCNDVQRVSARVHVKTVSWRANVCLAGDCH